MASALIFTDLDGTLLDHETYDWTPAAPLLTRLARADIPVVLASSKTAAEMRPLRTALGLDPYPMICENGAGIVPGGTGGGADDRQSGDYARLRDALESVPARLRALFEGFGDMGPARISAVTGLSDQDAARAADRAFSEPGLWAGDDDAAAAFCESLAALGVSARRGGRFLTLSFGGTKANRMAEVKSNFDDVPTIALGDAPNDAEMLQTADYGIVIPNPHGAALPEFAEEKTGRIRRAERPGPGGWSMALSGLLSELNIKY